jgi:hypothetical protein
MFKPIDRRGMCGTVTGWPSTVFVAEGRGHDQGGRAGAAGGLRVIGRVS